MLYRVSNLMGGGKLWFPRTSALTQGNQNFPQISNCCLINTDCAFFKSLFVLLKKTLQEISRGRLVTKVLSQWQFWYCYISSYLSGCMLQIEFFIVILNLLKMCCDEPFPWYVAAGRAAESSGRLPGPDGSSRPWCGPSRRQPALPHKDPSPPCVPLPGTRGLTGCRKSGRIRSDISLGIEAKYPLG